MLASVKGALVLVKSDNATDIGGYLPMVDPWDGPNVSRALSLVPAATTFRRRTLAACMLVGVAALMTWSGMALYRALKQNCSQRGCHQLLNASTELALMLMLLASRRLNKM